MPMKVLYRCCYPRNVKVTYSTRRRTAHSFVIARLAPGVSAYWTSHFGEQRATTFKTRPFLALRVSLPDIALEVLGNNDKESCLFIVSQNKPKENNENSYFALAPTRGEEKRILNVFPEFPEQYSQLYVHTLPVLQEEPASEAADRRHADSAGPYRLTNDSYRTFCRYVIDELASQRQRKAEDHGHKPTGGDEVAEADWESWSGNPPRERLNRPPWFAFEHLEFKDVAALSAVESCQIFQELLVYDQLTKDYSWHGVSYAIGWVKWVRQYGWQTDLIDPLTLQPYERSTPKVSVKRQDFTEQLNALHEMKIPYDGDPVTPKPEEHEFSWDEGPEPDYDDIPRNRSPIQIENTKVVAFDLYGAILDREAAISAAISHLKSSANISSQEVNSYIICESLQCREDSSRSYADLSRDTMRDFAQKMGIEVKEELLNEALSILLKPHIHEDVLPTLTALRARGYTLAILTCIDSETFNQFISSSLPMETLVVLASESAAPLYQQHPSLYSSLIQRCQSIDKNIKPDEILIVTTGQFRILEPAYAAGIPTAILQRPNARESRVNIDTTAPSLVIGNLPGICKRLGVDIDLPVVEANLPQTITNHFVAGYRILGMYQSAFPMGSTCSGFHLLTGSTIVIKDEISEGNDANLVSYEAQVYKLLEGHIGFPRVHWSGMYGGAHVIVMDEVGVNLEQLRRFCRGRLSLKTVLMLAEQLLARIELVHSKGLILRDMKPENCAMGSHGLSNVVHVFDFGLAKLYLDPTTGKHIAMREDRIPLGPGTAKYSSPNVQLRRDQSRRDDIAALGYSLLYLLHGRLPWQGIYAPTIEAKVQRIGEMKTGKAIRELLAQSPPEFTTYFDHFFDLGFEEKPDYELLKGVFRNRMKDEGWEYDWRFDWYDGGFSEGGTLIPEEYVTDIKFVTRKDLQ